MLVKGATGFFRIASLALMESSIWSSAMGIIFCMRPANERRRYNVTSSLIGWAHMESIWSSAMGIIFCMRPANERRRYNVTSSLIGWAHIQTDPWCQWSNPKVTQGCQVVLNFSILLLKLHFCYWDFHEILAKILKFVLIFQLFLQKILKFV